MTKILIIYYINSKDSRYNNNYLYLKKTIAERRGTRARVADAVAPPRQRRAARFPGKLSPLPLLPSWRRSSPVPPSPSRVGRRPIIIAAMAAPLHYYIIIIIIIMCTCIHTHRYRLTRSALTRGRRNNYGNSAARRRGPAVVRQMYGLPVRGRAPPCRSADFVLLVYICVYSVRVYTITIIIIIIIILRALHLYIIIICSHIYIYIIYLYGVSIFFFIIYIYTYVCPTSVYKPECMHRYIIYTI